jgi:hypothetical protein
MLSYVIAGADNEFAIYFLRANGSPSVFVDRD